MSQNVIPQKYRLRIQTDICSVLDDLLAVRLLLNGVPKLISHRVECAIETMLVNLLCEVGGVAIFPNERFPFRSDALSERELWGISERLGFKMPDGVLICDELLLKEAIEAEERSRS